MRRLSVRRALAPLLLLAALACCVETASAAFSHSSIAARGTAVPERLFHYTTTDAAGAIAKEGLIPGQSGRVFLTPQGGLSPLQAQIDLALPPNRAANALFEVDAGAMRRLGIDIPAPTPVGRLYNMPGGGLEVPIDRAIPPELLRRLR